MSQLDWLISITATSCAMKDADEASVLYER